MGLAEVHGAEVPTDALRNSSHSPTCHPRGPRPRCAPGQGDAAEEDQDGNMLARRQRHRGGGGRRLRRDETVNGCYGRLGSDLAACGLRQPGLSAQMKPNARRCALGLSTQRPWGLCRAPQYDWRVLLAQKRCPDTG